LHRQTDAKSQCNAVYL